MSITKLFALLLALTMIPVAFANQSMPVPGAIAQGF